MLSRGDEISNCFAKNFSSVFNQKTTQQNIYENICLLSIDFNTCVLIQMMFMKNSTA